MAERAFTLEDLVAGLQDIRLPTDAAGGQVAEFAAAMGLGLFLAFMVALLLPLIMKRSTQTRPETLAERIDALRTLPPEQRALALLHLLKERAPDAVARMGSGLYAPGGLPDPTALEAELLRAGGGDA
ncbi:hypothetical protein [Actibacterium lipolyticum]|uniref:Uncharacterized protein n=1 Tax=Actibacterium lipolyticum TaxID=1524263 RepID=A0A238KQ29_9RHOB|nr:hypothetical protein [Actibacterium lipolyticum]SMX44923.1 hypothetical protein COL8621_02668 [Actibacterium lipolyticum]